MFQRRLNGSVDFYRTWKEYKEGFGSLNGEFWLGNDKIHRLASSSADLQIDLMDLDGNTKVQSYSNVFVGSEADKYRLRVGVSTGTAGDSLANKHHDSFFSTKDVDNDKSSGQCANMYFGGWWYGNCHDANLNGQYGNVNHAEGIIWETWRGNTYSLKETSMKLRPSRGKLTWNLLNCNCNFHFNIDFSFSFGCGRGCCCDYGCGFGFGCCCVAVALAVALALALAVAVAVALAAAVLLLL